MILFDNVNTSLIVTSSRNSCSQSYLFHCANYWAERGDRVLYISKTPVDNLPPNINKENEEYNPDVFSRIRFMYLPRWQDLLQQLYSVHLHPHPVSVIIIQQLDHYCKDKEKEIQNDNTSLVCASIINAALICANKTSKPSHVICDFFSGESLIQSNIISNYFNNVWNLEKHGETFTLKHLTTKTGKITEVRLVFDPARSVLNIDKKYINVKEAENR